ncbi:MAG: hypothetical protein MUF21_12435, partial [Gemmatimonadaceae bacterium]|nr:hypothetical protein [Gemmatimonadaceae bacterium]MCU0627273.1 hypothetical protein [Gemmatimonadaceae bacterium]
MPRRPRSLLVIAAMLAAAPLGAQDARPATDPRWQGLHFRNIGPFRGGRVTAVTGVRQRKLEFWMGATGGGLWKTTDAGLTWRNMSDGWFASPAIGAVRVAPSNPDIVYAGTGSDGLRSNIIQGRGLYRSDDAGATWRFLGLRETGHVGAIEIHPTDPDIAFVAAIGQAFAKNRERGVYRTADGGRTWTNVLFLSDSTGAVDLEFKPDEPQTLYAAMWRAERKPWTIISGANDEGGVWKSVDGGTSWRRLGGGLPTGLIGKIDLAVSAAMPERLYALVEAPRPKGGLYRSDDAGETWTQVSAQVSLLNRPFYYTNVDADPRNADVVYVNNESFFKSVDGGKTFTVMATPHGDNHDMWIDPDDPSVFIQSNDGGANITRDGGRTWTTQYNQSTAEIYTVAVDTRWPYRVYGPQQDQGPTLIIPSLPPGQLNIDDPSQYWQQGPGCETGPSLPSPWNPLVVYGACKGQFSRYHLGTGQEMNSWVGAQFLYGHDPKDLIYRFQRVAPLVASPHVKGTLYHASQYVHRTRDDGVTWERISPDLTADDPRTQGVSGQPITRDITGEEFHSTLYAVRESPIEQGVIWAGANDGPVHVTRDDGKTWQRVTPPGLLPGGRVQSIEVSRHARGTAYVAIYRFLLGDFKPYAYRTTDYGKTWTLLTTGSNGVPADAPTRVLREDPDRRGLLYLGTEFGLYVSFDDGATWQSFQGDLPLVPVTDMVVHRKDLVLGTMGRGFWILDDLTPVQQLADSVTRRRAYLFAPRPAVRWRHAPSPTLPGWPEYPGGAATIDLWLGEAPATAPVIELRDEKGAVVRRITGSLAAGAEQPQGMRRPRGAGGAQGFLARQGHVRVRWDLLHEG